MPILADQNFSLYELIDWRNIYNIFSERRALLAGWCKTIELAIIERELVTDVYAGFQQVRYIAPILPRYRQIAGLGGAVWVFGQPDAKDPATDGLNVVALQPGEQLVKEWFLVVQTPAYSRALVAHELSKPGTPHSKRTFRGILTSDHAQVKRFADILRERVKTLTTT
ncbi:MAG: hypothetical protein IAE80_14675 [Anaerolinea sp.]|nr:hypothetical protein [Anaerolinea sp.]